ncbi:MAG: class I SAM-dependent methyltransferase [Oscillospiraceae bacterium]
MSYKEFSYFYDYFNYNADYDALFEQIVSWAGIYGVDKGIACDLGCGTGEITFRLYQKGYETIAVDNSDEMLDVFVDKRDELGYSDILVLEQDITQLDLYGTVDLFTCTFDTINHLEGEKEVQKLFDKVSLFMHPDGIFIFDMNTEYKHLEVLKDNQFDLLEDEADCHWKNTLFAQENRTKISITIDDKQGDEEYSEEFFEYFYSLDAIKEMLKKSGLAAMEIIDGESFGVPVEKTQRYLFMVKKEQ